MWFILWPSYSLYHFQCVYHRYSPWFVSVSCIWKYLFCPRNVSSLLGIMANEFIWKWFRGNIQTVNQSTKNLFHSLPFTVCRLFYVLLAYRTLNQLEVCICPCCDVEHGVAHLSKVFMRIQINTLNDTYCKILFDSILFFPNGWMHSRQPNETTKNRTKTSAKNQRE